MRRVMVLNPKGGSGKTTIATSIASLYAALRLPTVLFDHDAQGSSTRWLRVRPSAMPEIHGVAAYRQPVGVTRAWQQRLPQGTERVVVDTPAGVRAANLIDLVRKADNIVVPVLPSHIDIDAVSAFLDDLAALEPVRLGQTKVAVVANRVRTRNVVFKDLERFLRHVRFPFVTRLRDSQNYVRATERGLGIHDLDRRATRLDRDQWGPLLAWIEDRPVDIIGECEGHEPLSHEPESFPLPL
ncbi:MAG: ParA family protein [Ectothiorhodospiraceae bacterium]|nr:ParA family protein [Chromatiales bacterium]MCP5156777.1 ParA family protein [Ectothiorhodospiraceae bacterium]